MECEWFVSKSQEPATGLDLTLKYALRVPWSEYVD